jgi:spermidine/putrescine transport system substrate-binding protein
MSGNPSHVLRAFESQRGVTRRQAIQTSTLALAGLWLTACGGSSSSSGSSGELTGPLRFANWPQNIDFNESGKQSPTIVAFERQNDIEVKYSEAINQMNTWAQTLAQPLSSGTPTDYDLVDLDTRWTETFVRNDWLEKFDPDNVQTALKNVDRRYAPPWDPEFEYQFPYTISPLSVAFNRTKVDGEPDSIEAFFEPAYAGHVDLYADWQPTFSTVALLLRARGEIDNTPPEMTIEDAEKVHAFLKPFVENGHIRAFTGQEYIQDLITGAAWVALGVAGDIAGLGNPKIGLNFAKEGVSLAVDSLVIPKGAENKVAAEKMIDLIYTPERATSIIAYSGYPIPVKGARELLAKEGNPVAENPLVFPPSEVVERMYQYPTPEDPAPFEELMNDLKGLA